MISKLCLSKAGTEDVLAIVALVNCAFRGETSKGGWTTEADLLDGLRTDNETIQNLIETDDSMIILGKFNAVLLGSVHLQKIDGLVHIGMLAVSPNHQACGIGRRLLNAAEQFAAKEWHIFKIEISVISCRQELIEYYLRRGYNRTGRYVAFPSNPQLWRPKVTDLYLEFLEKHF